MRHVVKVLQHKIEAGSTAVDTYGQISASTTAWETGVVTRAKIEQLTGDEAIVARQVYARASHRLTIDYNSTLASTGGQRRAVEFEGRQMYIGGIIDTEMEHLQLILLCGEER